MAGKRVVLGPVIISVAVVTAGCSLGSGGAAVMSPDSIARSVQHMRFDSGRQKLVYVRCEPIGPGRVVSCTGEATATGMSALMPPRRVQAVFTISADGSLAPVCDQSRFGAKPPTNPYCATIGSNARFAVPVPAIRDGDQSS